MSDRGPAYRYRAYDLHIRSDISLPLDPLSDDSAGSEPDVTVHIGDVPRILLDGNGGRTVRTDLWQARPGAFLMHVEDAARFLVTGGRDVFIEPLRSCDDAIDTHFIGTVFAVLLLQRGLSILHAASVATADGAVLLIGRSGTGKSALAAALVESGLSLLADDVTALTLGARGRLVALPAFSHQRLWAHTLDRMCWRGRAQSRVRQYLEKYWVPAQRVHVSPLPVRAALVLKTRASYTPIDIEPLPPDSTFWALWNHTHRKRMMDAMRQRAVNFRVITAMARRIPVAQVTRPKRPFLLKALTERVEAHLRGIGPTAGAQGAQGGIGHEHQTS